MKPSLLRAAARWKIPRELALAVIDRDLRCIYCNTDFGDFTAKRSKRPSWEHIVNDESIVNTANIALCCIGCNSSKGTKPLDVWLESDYCSARTIVKQFLAPVAAAAIGGKLHQRLSLISADSAKISK